MKFISSLFFLLFISHVSALPQNVALKKPLTKEDLKFLDLQLNQCLDYEAKLNFTFNTYDFYDDKDRKGDIPNSISQVHEMEKELKGNYRDATIYNNIGMAYKGMFMSDAANKSFAKAFELAEVYVKNHPDSAIVHDLVASIYSNQGKLAEAIASFQTAYKLNNKDTVARYMIPMCHVFMGNFDSARASLNSMFTSSADDFDHICMLTMLNYWEKLSALPQLSAAEVEKLLKGKSSKQVFDLTKIDELYNRNRNKVVFELLYRFNKHIAVCVKSFMLSFTDMKLADKDIKFKLEDIDIEALNEAETFYTKYLNDTAIPNKYILYKSLANIYLLKGDTKKAISFSKTAIQLKPLKKSKYDDNAAFDYDNLAAAFLINKDTVSFERTMQEKFAVKPALNPLPEDYATMAKISFLHKDYTAAKKYAEDGLKMNPKLEDAIVCLAALDILNRNIKEAYKKLDDLYATNAQNSLLYILQGICSLHENDISTAYGSFKRARTLVGDPAWIDTGLLERFFQLN